MAKRRKKQAELGFMPEWIRWAADYPFLHVLPKEMTKEELEEETVYLKRNPCPNQLAMNMLLQYRGNPDRIERLITRVNTRYDKSMQKDHDDRIKQEEVEIASLEATWAAIKGIT